jgi:putative intracellular protease/amidase
MRVPLFQDHPSFRSLSKPRARVLVVLAPTGADLRSVRAVHRALKHLDIELVATTECQGEVDGEHLRTLLPNLLLIEAATREWDAILVAGGSGAERVAEDPFARQVISTAAAQGKPIAALGLGGIVLERARIEGFCADAPDPVAQWLSVRLGVPPATASPVAGSGLQSTPDPG